ncbi:MAG: hypothetical protein J5742_00955 [Alphaproteobacteria bacterium]|nr:hypothetical protein [Alphaproteobacteria bacterium]
MKIFDIKNLLRVMVVAVVCMASFGAYAYYDDDEDEDVGCQFFSPAYALCTIHAYNVGLAQNPTDSTQIADMNEVIAMKSTVIAQQMKQEYDFLNAMVKRFKTQLEKAVLTSKIEVLTGTSSSSTSSSSSSSLANNGLATAEDCDTLDLANIYDCLLRNLNKIENAVDRDTTNARKQLQNDIAVANGYEMCGKDKNCEDESGCDNLGIKKGISDCVKSLRRKVNKSKSEYIDGRSQSGMMKRS